MVVRSTIMDAETALYDKSIAQAMPSPKGPTSPQNNSPPGVEGIHQTRQSKRGPQPQGMGRRWDSHRQDNRLSYGSHYNGGAAMKFLSQLPNPTTVSQPSQANNPNIHLLTELINKLFSDAMWFLLMNNYSVSWDVIYCCLPFHTLSALNDKKLNLIHISICICWMNMWYQRWDGAHFLMASNWQPLHHK